MDQKIVVKIRHQLRTRYYGCSGAKQRSLGRHNFFFEDLWRSFATGPRTASAANNPPVGGAR